jgi:hypothetical protein
VTISSLAAHSRLSLLKQFDNCEIAFNLYEITYPDGSTETGVGLDVEQDFPVGISTVTFTTYDKTLNTAECTVEVNISDALAPTAICIDDLNITLGEDGTVTVPAALFDGGSFDIGCSTGETYDIDVQISVDGSAPADEYTFDCTQAGEVEVHLIFTDCAGNTSTCWSINTIDDKPIKLYPTVEATDESFCNAEDGTAAVTAVTNANGDDLSGDVTYEWSNGATTASISGLHAWRLQRNHHQHRNWLLYC